MLPQLSWVYHQTNSELNCISAKTFTGKPEASFEPKCSQSSNLITYLHGTELNSPSDIRVRGRRLEPHGLPIGWLKILQEKKRENYYLEKRKKNKSQFPVMPLLHNANMPKVESQRFTSKWSDSFSSSRWSFSSNNERGSRMKRWAMCWASSLSIPGKTKQSGDDLTMSHLSSHITAVLNYIKGFTHITADALVFNISTVITLEAVFSIITHHLIGSVYLQ